MTPSCHRVKKISEHWRTASTKPVLPDHRCFWLERKNPAGLELNIGFTEDEALDLLDALTEWKEQLTGANQ